MIMPTPEALSSLPVVDRRGFRDTIGLFATVVTVIAAQNGDQVHAMTLNAFASLSVRPDLMFFGVSKEAKMAPELGTGCPFSINFLREEQQSLSNYFGGQWHDPQPPVFEFDPWEATPRLHNRAAALACVVDSRLEGRDHWIIVGRVRATHRLADQPDLLLFCAGRYRRLATQEAPAPDLSEADLPAQILYEPW